MPKEGGSCWGFMRHTERGREEGGGRREEGDRALRSDAQDQELGFLESSENSNLHQPVFQRVDLNDFDPTIHNMF
ncbi:hypothetical protein ACE6H2_012471 [Prunus campanulata]